MESQNVFNHSIIKLYILAAKSRATVCGWKVYLEPVHTSTIAWFGSVRYAM